MCAVTQKVSINKSHFSVAFSTKLHFAKQYVNVYYLIKLKSIFYFFLKNIYFTDVFE